MKNIILFIILSTFLLSASAQENKKTTQKLSYKVHGFIKSDFWHDSRKLATSREGIFALYPLDQDLDLNGNDINAAPNFNYSIVTSRIGLTLGGISAFGAKITTELEADFAGISTATTGTFRIRQAHIRLDWENDQIIIGQTWHPLFVTEVFPSIISLNTGAPFQPFNRSPQIRYTRKLGNLKVIAAILSQRDFTSIGPIGRSYTYLSNSNSPNLHLQIKYHKNKSTLGIAADYKSLRPRQISNKNIIDDNMVQSISYMAYYKWQSKKFIVKAKATWAQNLSDQLVLGGYAVASIDTTTDLRTYTPTQHLLTWIDFDYIIKREKLTFIPGLFLGYAQNFGTLEENKGIYYAAGSTIDNVYRIAPNFSIKANKLMFSIEFEHTIANYGTANTKGIVSNTHSISNNRFLFTTFFFF